MPPKKGKKGKKGGKKDEPTEELPPEDTEPTEKEILLQQELDDITSEMEHLKIRVIELRQENEWLDSESQKVRIESNEYTSYMRKKTSKRQTTIVSLSDQNQKQINDIKEQKRVMLEQYEKTKNGLKQTMLEKENQLLKTKRELDELKEYKDLQQDQQTKIRELEKSVLAMRSKHSEEIQRLKEKFLKEKRQFQHDTESKVAAAGKQVNKEAMMCLDKHTAKIKNDNRQLRHKLLLLIRKSRVLHEHRDQLEEQKRQLLTEQQYARDLKNMRSTRQHQVYKSFGMLEEDEEADT